MLIYTCTCRSFFSKYQWVLVNVWKQSWISFPVIENFDWSTGLQRLKLTQCYILLWFIIMNVHPDSWAHIELIFKYETTEELTFQVLGIHILDIKSNAKIQGNSLKPVLLGINRLFCKPLCTCSSKSSQDKLLENFMANKDFPCNLLL